MFKRLEVIEELYMKQLELTRLIIQNILKSQYYPFYFMSLAC